MAIEFQKKKGLYIFNFDTADITNDVIKELCAFFEKLNMKKNRIALNLSGITMISAANFVSFINSKNINLLMPNSYVLSYISLTTRGILPPVFFCEEDLITRRYQFVKRKFALV